MASIKHKTLTLREKFEAIEEFEKKTSTVKDLMKKYGCKKTQIYKFLKNKEEIKREWANVSRSENSKRKLRETKNQEVNLAVFEWFCAARSKNIPVSGPMLQEQAKKIAEMKLVPDFRASNGWLESFRSRHKIKFGRICGEANDVDQVTVERWNTELVTHISGYDMKDIANGDETGLYFRTLPDKTLSLKNDRCNGGKLSKDRLTLFLCVFADGKFEKPLVIGKAARPRCFRNSCTELPVEWRSNAKAWMTASIMEEWLQTFNSRMRFQNRKVCLILDNATCHPHLELSNVKLVFLPPNCTSVCQPLDQGIIQCFKMHYRKLMLRTLITCMDSCQSVTELSKKISVLDAINYIKEAIKSLPQSSVTNCFQKAGFDFTIQEVQDTNSDFVDENVFEEIENLLTNFNLNPPISSQTYVKIDENISTENDDLDSDHIGIDTSHEVEEEELHAPVTEAEAFSALKILENFALQTDNFDIVQKMMDIKLKIEAITSAKKLKQTSIKHFLQEKTRKN